MMSTLLKLGLSGYDVKPRFGAFQCEYLLQNPLFFLGKNFGDTRHPYEKNEPTFDYFGGRGARYLSPLLIDMVRQNSPVNRRSV